MNINARDLLAEYTRFSAAYPFVHDVEAAHALPPFTLFAVASRETNMVDEKGDGDHGHGPWQYDDRTPGRGPAIARIDAHDIRFAADVAAGMLVDLRHRYGDWISAYNAYNSGQPQTRFTAHGDYGPDVDQRRSWLAANVPTPVPAPPPVPAPAPIPPLEASGMQLVTEFHPCNLPFDGQGHGWIDVDHDFATVAGLVVQGSSPPEDGYWQPVTVEAQPRDGKTRIDFYGTAGQETGVFVKVLTP